MSPFSQSCLAADMIKAGASAYISKVNPFEDLIQTIRSVVQSRPSLSAAE